MSRPSIYSDPSRLERMKAYVPPSPTSAYRVRFAESLADVQRAQRLRFEVFNLEMGEGLKESEAVGRDVDEFDDFCEHLLVENVNDGRVIGTYRMQSGATAAVNRGYYSEREFDFSPFEKVRSELLELGRACIAREHRNMVVLGLLWKGVIRYAETLGLRYLIGCSSLTSTDPMEGIAAYDRLKKYLVPERFITKPTEAFRCGGSGRILEGARREVKIPPLMFAYLKMGARLCGLPAIDREFGTIDFLTLMDLRTMRPDAFRKFRGGEL